MPRSRSRDGAEPRRRAWRSGLRGEFWAALYLRAKLYRISARRYKTPVGEIDIVARRGALTVFVEVKTRAPGADEEMAWAAVDRRRIVAAASHYVARHPHLHHSDQRFDVIFLAPFSWPRHVVDAFDTSNWG